MPVERFSPIAYPSSLMTGLAAAEPATARRRKTNYLRNVRDSESGESEVLVFH